MSMDDALQEIADFGQLQSALERIAELERENAELRKDAERYRYCRDVLYADDACCDDSAIDAAISRGQNADE